MATNEPTRGPAAPNRATAHTARVCRGISKSGGGGDSCQFEAKKWSIRRRPLRNWVGGRFAALRVGFAGAGPSCVWGKTEEMQGPRLRIRDKMRVTRQNPCCGGLSEGIPRQNHKPTANENILEKIKTTCRPNMQIHAQFILLRFVCAESLKFAHRPLNLGSEQRMRWENRVGDQRCAGERHFRSPPHKRTYQ
jgi:hypothetical protein